MIFYTLINLIWIPVFVIIAIVLLEHEIKNSDFFRSQPYSEEDIAITKKYGKVLGKLYHWFI